MTRYKVEHPLFKNFPSIATQFFRFQCAVCNKLVTNKNKKRKGWFIIVLDDSSPEHGGYARAKSCKRIAVCSMRCADFGALQEL